MVSVAIGKKIKKLKDDGLSQHKIAKKLGIAQSTVSDYLKSIGVSSDQSKTKKAVETKKTFDRERRLALNDMWFEKIESMLQNASDANTLRALATPYGVAEDKRSILEPMQPDGTKSGLAEMREEIHQERKNGLETSAEDM